MLPTGTHRAEVELEAGLTTEELAAEQKAAQVALARLHGSAVAGGSVCDWCRLPFPCPDSLLAGTAAGELVEPTPPNRRRAWKARDAAAERERWPDSFRYFCEVLEDQFPAWFVTFSPQSSPAHPKGCFMAVVYADCADGPMPTLRATTVAMLGAALREAEPLRKASLRDAPPLTGAERTVGT